MLRMMFGIVGLLAAGAGAVGADEKFPMPMDNLYANRISVETSDCLSVNLFNVKVDPAWTEEPAHFTITSTDDSDYSPSVAVHPAKAGSRTRDHSRIAAEGSAGASDFDFSRSADTLETG